MHGGILLAAGVGRLSLVSFTKGSRCHIMNKYEPLPYVVLLLRTSSLMYAGRGDWIGGRLSPGMRRKGRHHHCGRRTAAVKPASAPCAATVGEEFESPRRCEVGRWTRV
jgi:hypothetical protein